MYAGGQPGGGGRGKVIAAVAAAVVVVVAVAVLLVLVVFDDDSGGAAAATSSPEAVVRAFYGAVDDGDYDTALDLVCASDRRSFSDLGTLDPEEFTLEDLEITDVVREGEVWVVGVEATVDGDTESGELAVVREGGTYLVCPSRLPS